MKPNAHCAMFLLLCCVILLSSLRANGQTRQRGVPVPPSTEPVQVFPEHLLYLSFFAHLKHLEDKAQSANRKPGDETLNEHYKKKLKLSENEYQKLLKIAVDCDEELSAHRKRRMEIINRLRADYPNRKISKDQLPPVPEEVKQLQKEYEGILAKYSNKLKSGLKEEKTKEVTSYLRLEFGSQLRVLEVSNIRSQNPGKQRPPAFEK